MKKYFLILCCVLLSLPALAQVKVTGVVIDENGEGVPAATVRVKNAKTATVTDMDGKFTLTVPGASSVLQVSYIGYEECEQKVGTKHNLTITLKPIANVLEETVIVGFATQKKINATGAVKTIGDDVLADRPISNAVQGLQGTIAGLNISNDSGGGLGTEMNINIRGIGSIGEGSSSSPLVLIDGMEGDLSTINPNDIENISVLKDGASASIYGSRAPFGVILVTTKGGKNGFSVNYRGNVNVKQPISVPNPVDSYTFALMVNDAYTNTGGTAPFGKSQLNKILAYQRGELQYGTEAYENDDKWKSNQMAFGNTNWYDTYLKNHTTSQEHNVTFNGGYMTSPIMYQPTTWDRPDSSTMPTSNTGA